jgi:hypothetical protein
MKEDLLKKHMGKIMFSIVGVLTLAIIGLIVYVSKTSLANTVEARRVNAVSIIDQFKTLRGYYVKSVVKKVKGKTDFFLRFIILIHDYRPNLYFLSLLNKLTFITPTVPNMKKIM